MPDEFNLQETKAPFNMAISTLQRLDGILVEIRKVSADIFLPPSIKQATKVILVKEFFIQASPLLSTEIVSRYESEVLALKPKALQIIKMVSGHNQRTNDTKEVYDGEIELKLDKILIQIQRELQKEKYFMPPKKDLGSTVGRF